uniref:Uncharacterized protein n=1 Tax=Rhizophagus irregularis (strain DAOM 181602 / DAOM 197198 / MUCL 43194) TaxID=747089 RepID=U9TQC1_RHIID
MYKQNSPVHLLHFITIILKMSYFYSFVNYNHKFKSMVDTLFLNRQNALQYS